MSKMKSISNHNDGGIWFFMYSLVLVVAYAGLITYSAPLLQKRTKVTYKYQGHKGQYK
ncbi:uncharacterized protein CYBJADRAFT_165868 [Cyberlindnera jadinii NRRL Y-1542]|uniref:Uncharacterized protein n=1 Tax=Cyberlindnera jadinii (strain ATCC 18201 / CBS 1600 / BCRC 20928 / JCM 3617 / NBRC 0987 / NRRL Y-1542) TaxID=983966 RepID=A0A1E4S6G4_CYBJN|nr:hypothetical protein CYBJADRAFT_165868 [Cyberlindnera jadinii NRRL Y-1542]ODV75105.1 hypothetical protein CYBJADRAFT_165868 [Cyberlindnera jadinii NRRL Y-1542]